MSEPANENDSGKRKPWEIAVDVVGLTFAAILALGFFGMLLAPAVTALLFALASSRG